MQLSLPETSEHQPIYPFKTQLLKWIGNKQRFAHEIASWFPAGFNTYLEPFLGSGAVLATLAPHNAIASDSSEPLMDIWRTLQRSPNELKQWYSERHEIMMSGDKKAGYEQIKASYNTNPNGADLLFLSRSCYGGVIRFRKRDGYMSTPCGVHNPISPESFSTRVDEWHTRTASTVFYHADFEETIDRAQPGDIVYCDPPYAHSQAILYGAQGFELPRLFEAISRAKDRGAFIALSIDGTKKSGNVLTELPMPEGLFEQEAFVNCGRSMLRRFQMGGDTLEGEEVTDRLLLTY